jgi:hypothetical protein
MRSRERMTERYAQSSRMHRRDGSWLDMKLI